MRLSRFHATSSFKSRAQLSKVTTCMDTSNQHILNDDATTTADAVASVLSRSPAGANKSSPVKVFSYGSNSTKQLCQRLGRADAKTASGQRPFDAVPGVLLGYGRVFAGLSKRWGGAVASCYPSPSSQVLGLLVSTSLKELEVLDSFEIGYTRQVCTVLAKETSISHDDVYIYLKDDLEFICPPSYAYLQAIARMYEEGGHPTTGFEIAKVSITGSVETVTVQDLPTGSHLEESAL